jgi:hypothetical protein
MLTGFKVFLEIPERPAGLAGVISMAKKRGIINPGPMAWTRSPLKELLVASN